MLIEEMRAALAAAPRERLCDLSKVLWQAFAANAVTEAEAEEISGLIEARRAVGKQVGSDTFSKQAQLRLFSTAGLAHQGAPGPLEPEVGNGGPWSPFSKHGPRSGFPPRPPQRPPVRSVAVERRRRLAASGVMPSALAARFTTGELAVMRIVADEHRDRGSCRLCLDAIAARAGVSRSLAKAAIKQARRLGMVEVVERRRVGAKSLPNVVTVVDREWLAWIRRGRKSPHVEDSSQAGIGGRFQTTTETRGFREGASRAVEARARAAGYSHNAQYDSRTGAPPKLSGGENRGRR